MWLPSQVFEKLVFLGGAEVLQMLNDFNCFYITLKLIESGLFAYYRAEKECLVIYGFIDEWNGKIDESLYKELLQCKKSGRYAFVLWVAGNIDFELMRLFVNRNLKTCEKMVFYRHKYNRCSEINLRRFKK